MAALPVVPRCAERGGEGGMARQGGSTITADSVGRMGLTTAVLRGEHP
jgi:hypothetical protein